MKKLFLFIGCCLVVATSNAQGANSESSDGFDLEYREDQFYVGLTFNLLWNRPSGISQSGFSGGFHVGYTRDMPISKRRNLAIGLGLGYSVNTYGQNLFLGEDIESGQSVFANLAEGSYGKNRFTSHLIEAPLEIRWRTSVPDNHKFWRVYTGLRVGYLYHFNSRFEGLDTKVYRREIDELKRLRFGATFTFGWNTFNFHFYYSLNSLFNSNALILFDNNEVMSVESVGLNVAKIGLMFYIL